MAIEIREVKSRKDLKTFIHLPAKIHKNHFNWVPPVYMDEWTWYNPKKNLAFGYSDTVLYLAYIDNKAVGRIMGIINHKYNVANDIREGRFMYPETYEDFDVAKALLIAVENWAREKEMDTLVGPLGFSDKDPQGLLIDGFDEPVVISSTCNFPYLTDFVEKAGYKKHKDLVVYKMLVPEVIPDFYQKIYERANRNNPSLRVVELKNKWQLKPYIRPVLSLMNETFKDIYGFVALSEKEMDEFASRYLLILDARFIKVIENEKGEVIAFVLAMPDISEGIKKSRGYVLPFGVFHILRSQKKTKQLNLLLGGIREDYRNTGIDTILGVKMFESAHKAGLECIDSHLELETNLKMRAEMERMGGKVYKTFRIFRKEL
jgi:GNAT superfamily N-acetyltransferase